jgi:hypothetical protein
MMIPIQWFLNKRINIKLVTSCALSLALIVTPAAQRVMNPVIKSPCLQTKDRMQEQPEGVLEEVCP